MMFLVPPVARVVSEPTEARSAAHDDRLAAVRARLENGYYERHDVARAVARRIVVDLVGKEPPSA